MCVGGLESNDENKQWENLKKKRERKKANGLRNADFCVKYSILKSLFILLYLPSHYFYVTSKNLVYITCQKEHCIHVPVYIHAWMNVFVNWCRYNNSNVISIEVNINIYK